MGTWMIQNVMHANECVQYDACSMMTNDMLGFGCDWGPSIVGLWDFMDEMIKIWHLQGVFDPSTFATPNAFDASIGWSAGGDFDILCLHGQLICCVALDCATKGDPIMVALRILRDTSH
ncbi:hypothetical protein QL285_033238 [Trifolium repens]|nr:hypothetical protein QL285_033238 [Trifolium repens]